jgi:hypothetical protein
VSIFSDHQAMQERQEAMRRRMEMRKLIKSGLKDFRKARRKKFFSRLKSKT